MKPMTAEQIEETITQGHANVLAILEVTREQRVIDRALTGALRTVFSVGQDNGQALMFERATTLLGDNVADVKLAQLGRSLTAIWAWCRGSKGRMFAGCYATASGGIASLYAGDGEKLDDGYNSHYEYGADEGEALTKLATWCIEHTAKAKRDTEPAPALTPSEPTVEAAPAADGEGSF